MSHEYFRLAANLRMHARSMYAKGYNDGLTDLLTRIEAQEMGSDYFGRVDFIPEDDPRVGESIDAPAALARALAHADIDFTDEQVFRAVEFLLGEHWVLESYDIETWEANRVVSPPQLDVERLAQSLEQALDFEGYTTRTDREMAQDIAAAYSALAEKPAPQSR